MATPKQPCAIRLSHQQAAKVPPTINYLSGKGPFLEVPNLFVWSRL